MAAFRPLFSLRGIHEFFAGGLCAALDFVPTPGCERLADNAGLLIRRAGGSLTVFFDPDRTGALPDEGLFDFRVLSQDAYFYNYTDGISPEAGKLLYFCSDSPGLPADGRLSREAWVSGADLCPEGLVPPELVPGLPTALFRIRIAAGAKKLENPSYYLPLRARRTTWQYYISGPGIAGDELCVTAPGAEEAFEYRGQVDLPNGRPASHFRSKAPLPLLHDQPLCYSLRERHNGRLLVRKLPVPSPRLLARENFDGEEVLTSQMFVNL